MPGKQAPQVLAPADAALLDDIALRAWRFFDEKTDARTGLAHDRARLDGSDTYDIASTAATGYGLAALCVASERGWIKRGAAAARAEKTLRFLLSMPHERGWMFHFVHARDGSRAWKSEASTIDTALLVLGALAAGEYFGRDSPNVERLAKQLYARLDWQWALTNGGQKPRKQVLSHGWKPEAGFLAYDYGAYSEAISLLLLGLGAPKNPLPASCWDAIERPTQKFDGITSLRGGPIFIHQMPHGWLPLRGRRDRLGWNYWISSANAMRIHRRFCAANATGRETYARGFWGLNASDGPRGYAAHGAPDGPEDGTISPTGAVASITFDASAATAIARKMKGELGARIWGRYGFANAFNVRENWFGPDVIGIDLGMALLAIENHRSGLMWRLAQKQNWVARAYEKAGLQMRARSDDDTPVARLAGRGDVRGLRRAGGGRTLRDVLLGLAPVF